MFPIDSRNKPSAAPAPTPDAYRSNRIKQPQEVIPVDTNEPAEEERRRRPERRFNTRRYEGKERRRKVDRRRPELLDARYGRPERLNDRRGAKIDVTV
ncbi:hypothetical protein [Allohahella sp. A8]|uniref:hypothetical protein n=1 Tax=Allohahella sp. A8 TaxID=3141461 RepID=UPI003A805218